MFNSTPSFFWEFLSLLLTLIREQRSEKVICFFVVLVVAARRQSVQVGLATVAAASWSLRIQMTSGLLTKVLINILIGVRQMGFVFSFLTGGLEYIKAGGIIWQVNIGINFHHGCNIGNLELVLCPLLV